MPESFEVRVSGFEENIRREQEVAQRELERFKKAKDDTAERGRLLIPQLEEARILLVRLGIPVNVPAGADLKNPINSFFLSPSSEGNVSFYHVGSNVSLGFNPSRFAGWKVESVPKVSDGVRYGVSDWGRLFLPLEATSPILAALGKDDYKELTKVVNGGIHEWYETLVYGETTTTMLHRLYADTFLEDCLDSLGMYIATKRSA